MNKTLTPAQVALVASQDYHRLLERMGVKIEQPMTGVFHGQVEYICTALQTHFAEEPHVSQTV